MALATLFPLAGCGGIGAWDYLGGGSSVDDPYKDGFVEILPTSLTLRVNERRTVVGNLDGRIAYFVRYHWTVSAPSIEVTPRPCSQVANNHRECPAEITAVGSGEVTVTFTASVHDFFTVRGSLRVSVLP